MEQCIIEIVTLSNGEKDLFCAQGSYSRTNNKFEVQYKQNGDFATLRFDEAAFFTSREGETNLSGEFRQGVRTALRLGGCGVEGEIPVETMRYALLPLANGCLVELNYKLIFQEEFQTFQLKLKILSSEEQ